MITKAKYADETLNFVSLTFDDGRTGQVTVKDGIRRKYTDEFNEWIANGGVIEPQYTDEELFDIAKKNATQRIKDGFRDAMDNGTLVSIALGIEIDNRRGATHNDKDNLQAVINLGTYPITWIGTTATEDIPDEAIALAVRTEMELDGMSKFQHKWEKEALIESATTVEELEAVTW